MIDMHAEGTGAVSGSLTRIAERALNPEPAFEAMTDRAIEAEKRLFASSSRLAPLKRTTVKRKARSKNAHTRANAHKPLVATGRLERALTTKGVGAQPVKLTRDEWVFGISGGRNDLHYARYQAKLGRDPLVSPAVVRRFATRELAEFLLRHG